MAGADSGILSIMVATLLALGCALLTVVAYGVAADRLDYATVQRRQLDVWVATIGFVCLVTILYGSAEVRRAESPVGTAVPFLATEAPAVARHAEPDLHRVTLPEQPAAAIDTSIVPQVVASADQASSQAAGNEQADSAYYVFRRPRPDVVPTAPSWAPPPTAPAMPSPPGELTWQGVLTPMLEALPIATPTIRFESIAVPSPAATDVPREPTVAAPPPRPMPTLPVQLPPLATPTPQCGDPQDIRVELVVLDAYVDRDGTSLGVTYRAEVRNRSAFPVTLTDISAVAESGEVSQRYGHRALPSVALEPGVLHRLDGRVELTKSPSPFEMSVMCVSFVPETCGRSVPYRLTKHCLTTRGF